MTEEEARKINDLYKQIDVLNAQNQTLVESVRSGADLAPVLDRLQAVEDALKALNQK
jgi:hypothetical protein